MHCLCLQAMLLMQSNINYIVQHTEIFKYNKHVVPNLVQQMAHCLFEVCQLVVPGCSMRSPMSCAGFVKHMCSRMSRSPTTGLYSLDEALHGMVAGGPYKQNVFSPTANCSFLSRCCLAAGLGRELEKRLSTAPVLPEAPSAQPSNSRARLWLHN